MRDVVFLCHSRESGNLLIIQNWIPAFAGMTSLFKFPFSYE